MGEPEVVKPKVEEKACFRSVCPWCYRGLKIPDFVPPEIITCPYCVHQWVMLKKEFVPGKRLFIK